MIQFKSALFFVLSLLSATNSFAAPAVVSGDYLEGKWSESGTQGCTSDQATYVIFNSNRTLQAGHGKKISAVGFWEPGDDVVILHLLVSPSGVGGGHPFYQKKYYYQYMAPRLLSMQADKFEYTFDSGRQVGEKRTLTRCR